MKNNLMNGAIIGIVIGTLGIGGGIFIANNKSIDIPQIKQEETANQETNKSEDKKEDTKTNNKEDKTEDKSEDTKSKSKDNNTKSKEKSTTSNKAVTESNNQKVACAICGKKDYIDNMWITENHYECSNCVYKCPYCGKQMQEVYPSNWYCVNPNCYNCIDDYDRQKYNPANPGDSTHTGAEDTGGYDPEPWDDPTNNSQWFGTD